MGTDYSGEGNCGGIIPQVMDTIFRKVDTSIKDTLIKNSEPSFEVSTFLNIVSIT